MRFYKPGNHPPAHLPLPGVVGGAHHVALAAHAGHAVLALPPLRGVVIGAFVSNSVEDAIHTFHLDRKVVAPGCVLQPALQNANNLDIAGGVARCMIRQSADVRQQVANDVLIPHVCYCDQDQIADFQLTTPHADDGRRFEALAVVNGLQPVWLDAGGHEATYPAAPDRIEVRARSIRGLPAQGIEDPPGAARPRLPLRPGNEDETEDERRDGELWIQLLHRDNAGTVLARDVLLFTVAPFLLCSNIDPVETIYTVETNVNHPWVASIRAAALAAGNIPVVTFVQNPEQDVWARDQAILGYWSVPMRGQGGFQEVFTRGTFVCPRHYAQGIATSLATYNRPAPNILPAADRALVRDLYALHRARHPASEGEALDYGGNVIATPPILQATPNVVAGDDGPAVDAHAVAPYGKILLGDGTGYGDDRAPTLELHDFLFSQAIQPLVFVNTGWLNVGHVDEIVSILPVAHACAATGAGAKVGHNGERWTLLLADMDLAWLLLQYGAPAPGRRWRDPQDPADFKALPTFLTLQEATEYCADSFTTIGAGNPLLDPNVHEPKRVLARIQARLRTALDLTAADVVSMPVLFDPLTDDDVAAILPDTVNLLPLNGNRVIVPKPWGPRVSGAHAAHILTLVCGYMGIPPGVLRVLNDASVSRFLRTETVWRPRPAGGWSADAADERQEVADAFEAVLAGVSQPDVNADPDWAQFTIEHVDSFDLFETYIAARFLNLGVIPIFVDDWDQAHKGDGEVHCATNEARTPSTIPLASKWWRLMDDDEADFPDAEDEDEDDVDDDGGLIDMDEVEPAVFVDGGAPPLFPDADGAPMLMDGGVPVQHLGGGGEGLVDPFPSVEFEDDDPNFDVSVFLNPDFNQ